MSGALGSGRADPLENLAPLKSTVPPENLAPLKLTMPPGNLGGLFLLD